MTQSIATPQPLLWAAPRIEQEPAAALDVSPHPGADGLVQDERPPLFLQEHRFHQPCLLPGRIPGEVRTVIPVPRGGHLPMRAARTGGTLPRQLDGTTTGRLDSPSLPACATRAKRCLHTRRFGTLAGPPPPVGGSPPFCSFIQLPGWNCFELLPCLVHCCFRIRNVHRSRHWNTFVYQILVTHRIVSLACDVIFMTSRWT